MIITQLTLLCNNLDNIKIINIIVIKISTFIIVITVNFCIPLHTTQNTDMAVYRVITDLKKSSNLDTCYHDSYHYRDNF